MMRRLTLLALLVLGVSGCATNPVTGERELVLVSEAQEIRMGREADEQVARTMGYYPDDALRAYVSDIGLGMAHDSERPDLPWKVEVVDSPVVNAFAIPGGYVYLTRGILAYMNTEAAMAGILGHEIGHITARHTVQQISRAQLAGIGLGVGAIVVPEVRPFGDLLETGVGLMFLKFGRDDERQSDALGVRYSVEAGYDASEMASFFQVLDRMGERPGSELPGWLSTHPQPEDREQRILQLYETEVPRDADLRTGEEEFKRQIDGLIFGENPREGFMDGNRFKHPDLRFQVDFPPNWNIQNTPHAVYAGAPQRDAAIQLTATRVEEGTAPEDHASRFFRDHELEYGTGERMRIGGFPAYRAPFRVRTQQGVLLGDAGFLVDGDMAYEILGYTYQQRYRQYRNTFLGVIDSFDRLTDRAALRVQPHRIALYRVPAEMSARQAFSQSGADPASLEELSLLNNLRLDDRVGAGKLLKILSPPLGSQADSDNSQ